MEINELERILEHDGIVFLTYGGFLSQSLIVGMTEALEKESDANDLNMTVSNNLLTIFIELSQNMMNYSKLKSSVDEKLDPKGLVIVGFDKAHDEYYIFSRNIVSKEDKALIAPKIDQVKAMNKEELKKLYRELRKSGRGKHEKGAGIGFVEIARRCDRLEYSFVPIDDETYYFAFKTIIKNR